MKRILTAAIALSVLASAGAASAQSYQGRPQQGGYQVQGGYAPAQGQGQRGGRDGRGGQGQGDYQHPPQPQAGYYGPGGMRSQDGYAQGYARGYDPRYNGYDRRDDRYDRRDERYDSRYERRADRRYNAGRYDAPRGYQARDWRRGDHLPPQYRGRGYQVDYRAYRLPPPPRGYQYTRVNDDVVLTAVASGLIALILFDMFE